jgi:HlyD family secretion protein
VAVDLGRVVRGSLEVFVEEEGQTRLRERYLVTAPLSGYLVRLEIEPGDPVDENTVLARVTPPPPLLLDERSRAEAEARLDAAMAQERQAGSAALRARAAREFAVRDAERARGLARRNAVAQVERERAELAERVSAEDLAAAELQRRVAAAGVRTARAVLGQVRRRDGAAVEVMAPAAGIVLRVLRESAGAVAAGAPLVEIGDPSDLEVVVDVLSSDAIRIAVGAPVWIDQWGGDRPLLGRARLVEPAAFTRISALGVEEQRVNVVVRLDERPPALGDGFRVEARIRTWRGDGVLTVPASALFRRGDGWAVYAAVSGRARLVPIEVGHRGRLDVEVTRGLAEGGAVVLYPGDRVTEGARIQPH